MAPLQAVSAFDAATIRLSDGISLRQVGIAAPQPGTCAAQRSTEITNGEVRKPGFNYQLVGSSDAFGNQWAYIRVNGSDLGELLASQGWVYALTESPTPASYTQSIIAKVESARASGLGQFGPACGSSAPEGPAPAPPAAATLENGTWIVGVDIQPGIYRSAGPDGSYGPYCYWERTKTAGGAIIKNGNTQSGQQTVAVERSDGAFHSKGCQPWVKIR